MQLQTVLDYKALISHIADIIEVSGYRNDYIAKKLGMKAQNFSVKKQRASWKPDEIEKLFIVIENEDVEDYLLILEMRSRKNEETITLAEYKKELAAWK